MISSTLLDEAGRPLSSSFPVLVTDSWGTAHAFWTQLPREGDSQSGAIYHARWDGSSWSEPIGILFSPERPMRSLSGALDTTGRIHIVWTAGAYGPVWHSSAPALQADSAGAWSVPSLVSVVNAWGLGLSIDSADRCHVAFCTGGDDDGCYHTSSVGGGTWTPRSSNLRSLQ